MLAVNDRIADGTDISWLDEAQRCLNCKNRPCVAGCPVNVRIPEFIAKVAEGDFAAAYEIITSTNALPALSGRVCAGGAYPALSAAAATSSPCPKSA